MLNLLLFHCLLDWEQFNFCPTLFFFVYQYGNFKEQFLKVRAESKKVWYNRKMISHNEMELMALGEQLGKLLEKQDVMILSGDLGAGKTTFTKGLARGLGIKQMIKSPTYTIVREYEGRLPLYHMDVYRIGNDPDSIDLDDFIYGEGVTVIEWGELIASNLPDGYLKLFIRKLEDGRKLEFEAVGARAEALLASFEKVRTTDD